MSKKTKKKRGRPAEQMRSRPWGLYAMAAVILVVIAGPIVSAASSSRRAKESVPRPSSSQAAAAQATHGLPKFDAEEQFRWQEEHQGYVNDLLAAVDAAASGDAYAEKLARTFRERLTLYRILPGGMIHMVFDPSRPPPEFDDAARLVVMTKDEARHLPNWGGDPFSFSRGDFNFVKIPMDPMVLGVVALHEMVHWDDIMLSERERRDAPDGSDEWTMGEVRAHLVEDAAARRLTNGALDARVKEVVASPTLCKPVPGVPTCLPTDAGLDRLLTAFPRPPKGPNEMALRNAIVILSVAFSQSSTDREKMDAYRRLTRQSDIPR